MGVFFMCLLLVVQVIVVVPFGAIGATPAIAGGCGICAPLTRGRSCSQATFQAGQKVE
jgi:hypothetical protein